MVFTIVSGGQTGVDRAALDVAIALGVPHDGWCPKGRRAEDGVIDGVYNLSETPSRDYAQRTRWNVRDTDATVIFSTESSIGGGTALTIQDATRMEKPHIHLSRAACDAVAAAELLTRFLASHAVRRLNVAGPRISQQADAAEFATDVLRRVLRVMKSARR